MTSSPVFTPEVLLWVSQFVYFLDAEPEAPIVLGSWLSR